MANESPKRPIRRVPVPSSSKKVGPVTSTNSEKESKIGQTILLFLLFLFVGVVVYIPIFRKDLISDFVSSSKTSSTNKVKSDSTATDSSIVSSEDQVSTVLGENNNNSSEVNSSDIPIVYPPGTKYYLIAGTFIFYPYAEKCRDKYIAEGYEANIVSTGDVRKFHRIYLESSEDVNALRAKRDELRTSKGLDVWIYAE